jgi:hypothetical protein
MEIRTSRAIAFGSDDGILARLAAFLSTELLNLFQPCQFLAAQHPQFHTNLTGKQTSKQTT